MRIIDSETEFSGAASVLALGMFDGVHRAHQALIRRATELASEMGAKSVVCTFDKNPLCVLAPDRAPEMLLSLDERLKKIASLGADYALVTPFTRELADQPAREFLAGLVRGLRARAVVAGFNYTFGSRAAGNAELVRSMGREMGFQAEILPAVLDEGERVSSTLIRELLQRGDTERARRLLRADL